MTDAPQEEPVAGSLEDEAVAAAEAAATAPGGGTPEEGAPVGEVGDESGVEETPVPESPGDRLVLAERQAEVGIGMLKVALAQARREDARNAELGTLVSQEVREQTRVRVEVAQANLTQAMVTLDGARLNLQRAAVRAPTDGLVTNLDLRQGAYATAGAGYGASAGPNVLLDGLEYSNDRARKRAIIIHGADYADPAFLAREGKLGRSYGCFSVAHADLPRLRERMGEGRLLFAWA